MIPHRQRSNTLPGPPSGREWARHSVQGSDDDNDRDGQIENYHIELVMNTESYKQQSGSPKAIAASPDHDTERKQQYMIDSYQENYQFPPQIQKKQYQKRKKNSARKKNFEYSREASNSEQSENTTQSLDVNQERHSIDSKKGRKIYAPTNYGRLYLQELSGNEARKQSEPIAVSNSSRASISSNTSNNGARKQSAQLFRFKSSRMMMMPSKKEKEHRKSSRQLHEEFLQKLMQNVTIANIPHYIPTITNNNSKSIKVTLKVDCSYKKDMSVTGSPDDEFHEAMTKHDNDGREHNTHRHDDHLRPPHDYGKYLTKPSSSTSNSNLTPSPSLRNIKKFRLQPQFTSMKLEPHAREVIRPNNVEKNEDLVQFWRKKGLTDGDISNFVKYKYQIVDISLMSKKSENQWQPLERYHLERTKMQHQLMEKIEKNEKLTEEELKSPEAFVVQYSSKYFGLSPFVYAAKKKRYATVKDLLNYQKRFIGEILKEDQLPQILKTEDQSLLSIILQTIAASRKTENNEIYWNAKTDKYFKRRIVNKMIACDQTFVIPILIHNHFPLKYVKKGAVMRSHFKIIRYLIENNHLSPNEYIKGGTILHWGVYNGAEDVLEMLIEEFPQSVNRGLRVDVQFIPRTKLKSFKKQTPFDMAIQRTDLTDNIKHKLRPSKKENAKAFCNKCYRRTRTLVSGVIQKS